MSRSVLLFYVIGCLLLLASFSGIQMRGGTIVLRDEKLSFTPKEFYIAGVVDDRREHRPIASLLVMNPGHAPVNEPADLPGGAALGIKQFLDRNLRRDTSLRPVTITIKELKLTESAAAGGRIAGHLVMDISFELNVNDTTVHLMNYKGGIRYDRPQQQADAAEPAIRHGISEALSAFNKWINSEAENNALLAKSVKVNFTDHFEQPEGDTIYYSVNRPLKWADFKELTGSGKFEAEVFTSIGYSEKMEVAKGVINLTIELKVDLPKSDCLVKAGARNDYTLNHEQRHFDIEKLVGERFKRKIMAMHLPVDNFDGPINVSYLETLREATRLQKQYDAETRHGMDEQAQARWNEKIDRELKECGVKK